MALRSCPACAGLVPQGRTTCLHCDAPLAPPAWRWLRRVLGAATAGVATVTLMACYGGPVQIDDCVDEDHDGWYPSCYDQPCDPRQDPYCDCNDANANIHPGAPDPLGDGLDSDCSGEDGPAKTCTDCPDAHPPPVLDSALDPDAWWQDDAPLDASSSP